MLAPISSMTHDEIVEYVEVLEDRVKELEKKTDNRKRHTPQEIRIMRRLHRDGRPNVEIADIFGCNAATVSRIVRGVYYSDV